MVGRHEQSGARSALGRLRARNFHTGMTEPPHLFLNTHPRELADRKLGQSLERLRENWPDQALTLEIHESAVTKGSRLAELRLLLRQLDIKLAYDDFGVGESRLNDLAETAPDYVKFDMSLVRDIDSRHAAAAAGRRLAGADGPQPRHHVASRGRGNGRRGRDLPADGFRSGARLSLRLPAPPRNS